MGLKNFLHREIYLPLIHFYDLIQDFKRGIKTTENHEISELGFSDEIGNKYQPIGYKRLIEVIKFAVTQNRHSCFIDAGCGKGRPLYIALEQGFNNVIGVEISKKLFKLCKKNLTKYDGCYTLVCSDIDNFQFSYTILPDTIFYGCLIPLFDKMDMDVHFRLKINLNYILIHCRVLINFVRYFK